MIQIELEHLVSQEDMVLPDSSSISKGSLDDSGEITTHTLVGSRGEVHIFWHNSPTPHFLYLGGYGISVPHDAAMTRESGKDWLAIDAGGNHSIVKVLDAPEGLLAEEILEPKPGWLHSHSFGGRGAFPHWQSKAPVSANTIVAIFVDGARDTASGVDGAGGHTLIAPEIAVEREHGALKVTFEGKVYTVKVPYCWV